MTRQELLDWLSIDDEQLDRLLERGLPAEGHGQYSMNDVAGWLNSNGLTDPPEPELPKGVVRTRREAAAALERSVPTIDGWLAQGCPGENGSYDIGAMRVWREERDRQHKRPASYGGQPYLTDARLAHILKVHLAWERVELQALGVPEPDQTRRIIRLLYSAMALLDGAGFDAGAPTAVLIESLGLTNAVADAEAWYSSDDGRKYTDEFERLCSALKPPTY